MTSIKKTKSRLPGYTKNQYYVPTIYNPVPYNSFQPELPNEILQNIFRFLDSDTIFCVRLTCTSFKDNVDIIFKKNYNIRTEKEITSLKKTIRKLEF